MTKPFFLLVSPLFILLSCKEVNKDWYAENDRLIPMDLLSSDFYRHPERIGYPQSGYIMEHLLTNYTISQFKQFCTKGYENFQKIYGLPYAKVQAPNARCHLPNSNELL